MSEGHDEKKIEALQDNLYARRYPDITNQPKTVHEQPDIAVEKFWKHNDQPLNLKENRRSLVSPFFKKVLIGSGIFFILAAGFAFYIFVKGLNVVSADKINISFLGPVSVAAGSELDFDIVVQNGNESPLQNVILYIDYPDGTKQADDLTKDLIHETENLGDIPQGGTGRRTIRSVLFGAEHTTQEINVALEYSVKNSNGSFRKEKSYDVALSSAPVTISVTGPDQAVSGDSVQYSVDVTSNASVPLNDLIFKPEYPFGFTFTSGDPAPSFDTNIWAIPSLAPGEKKTFVINGRVEGEEHDERVFRFSVGAGSSLNEKEIATNYLTQTNSLILSRPLIGTALNLNGSTDSTYVIKGGSSFLQAQLSITNNMPTQLLNAKVSLAFGGSAFDPSSTLAQSSIYRAADKTINWDKASLPALGILDPGQTVNMNFTFSSLSPAQLAAIQNGNITLNVVTSGQQVKDANSAAQTITTNLTRTVKVQTVAGFLSQLSYGSGPFKNTGPIPPKVDAKTTYTVTWTLSNSSNLLSNTKITAVLPPYVHWLNKISPGTENLTWDQDKSTLTWQIGDLPPNSTKPVRQVAFQIEVQPLNSQAGSPAQVISGQTLIGTDSYTTTGITINTDPLTTASIDLQGNQQNGIVRP